MVSLCQFVLMAVGAWVALRLELRHVAPVPAAGPDRRRRSPAPIGIADRPARAAAVGPVPGAHHADGGGRPSPSCCASPSSPTAAAGSSATRRAGGATSRAAPARRSPRATPPTTATASIVAAPHVPARALARPEQGRAGVGRHPPEPGHRGGRRRATPRCTSCGRSRWPRSWPASPARSWPAPAAASTSTSSRSRTRSAAGRRADGRRLQPLAAPSSPRCSCASCRRSSTTGACRPSASRSCSASACCRCC